MLMTRDRLCRSCPVLSAVVLAFALLLGLGLPTTAQEPLVQRAKWVPDGDTMLLESGLWVRLQGLDAPEMEHGDQPAQYHARESTTALRRLVMDQSLTLISHGKDRYGRILGICLLGDGTDVAEAMVRDGRAYYYAHPDHGQDLRDRLLAAQQSAMRRGRGFWPRIRVLSDGLGQWVGNSSSGRAFPQGSKDAARLSPAHRVALDSLWAVFMHGYSPARGLCFWPLEE